MTPARLATLDDDGWALLDAEAALAAGDGVYWLPARSEREQLERCIPLGGYVKLIFRIADPAESHAPATELMWVVFGGRDGGGYHGHLDSSPGTEGATARRGMPVSFGAEHVIDFAGPSGGGQASKADDVLHCDSHGPSVVCHVCEHLTGRSEKRGFNTAANAIEQRPDAWCDACDRLLDGVAGWDDLGDRHPEIRLICGGCYDLLRRRHEHVR